MNNNKKEVSAFQQKQFQHLLQDHLLAAEILKRVFQADMKGLDNILNPNEEIKNPRKGNYIIKDKRHYPRIFIDNNFKSYLI
jgi:hypothetical protein